MVARCNPGFTLKHCLFRTVKLTKNADPHKYFYSWYGTIFNSCSLFLFPGFDWCKSIVSFSVDHSSFFYIDNAKKDIFVLGEGPAQELDDITIKAEAKYSNSFSISQKEFCLSIHYNGSSSFLFVNAKNINSLISIQSKKLKTKTTPTTFRKYFQKRFS